MRSINLIAALAATATLGLAASAEASTFCVGPVDGCPAGAQPNLTLAGALLGAQQQPGHDEILIGPGVHTTGGGFAYDAAALSNTVAIRGAGAGATTLEADKAAKSGDFTTLSVTSAGKSEVRDLRIVAPARKMSSDETRALRVEGPVAATGVAVGDSWGSTYGASEGVLMDGGTLAASEVSAPSGTAVQVEGSHPTAITGSTLTGRVGVRNSLGGPLTVARSRVNASVNGVVNEIGDALSVSNSVIRLTGSGAFGLRVRAEGDSSTGLSATHVTIDGGGRGGTVGVVASAYGGDDAWVEVVNSIIHGVGNGTWRYSDDPESLATIDLRHVNYDEEDDLEVGAGKVKRESITVHQPGFADAAAGDLRLVRTSPLRDLGRTPDLAPLDELDLAGAPRKVGEHPDLGAHEYQGSAPSADFALPAEVVAGTPLSLSGAGSGAGDPGDAIASWSWSFGDGAPPAEGPEATHAWTQPGTYTVTLTVTDLDGRSATKEASLTVLPLEPKGGLIVDPKDVTAPVISALRRRGRVLRFSLSEAAAVEVRLLKRGRARKYRPVGAARRAAGTTGANRVKLRRLTRGRYRVVVTATDRWGNRSVKRLAFRVVR